MRVLPELFYWAPGLANVEVSRNFWFLSSGSKKVFLRWIPPPCNSGYKAIIRIIFGSSYIPN